MILPALATKTDLVQLKAERKQEFRDGLGELNARVITFHGDMRSELRELKAEMHRWMTATMISLLIGFGGLLIAVIRHS
jgi:ATP-dependent helicase YprA (DUF1998 family)